MTEQGSVTTLAGQLRSSDPTVRNNAAAQLWERYSQRLLEKARLRLDDRIRRREDEQDVVQSMYKSFCHRIERGMFTLDNRNDIWNLLVTMTLNKVRDTANRHTAEARDVGREQHASPNDQDAAAQVELLNLVHGSEPTPEEVAIFTDMVEKMLEQDADEQQQRILLWKLEGYTNEQIADKLECAVRTVERKVRLLRDRWLERNP